MGTSSYLIRQRRERIAVAPRVGDALIVQRPATKHWPKPRGRDVWERVEVIAVTPHRAGARLSRRVKDVRVRITFPRAPRGSMWRLGGFESTEFAGEYWMSWPSLVRRAQATSERDIAEIQPVMRGFGER